MYIKKKSLFPCTMSHTVWFRNSDVSFRSSWNWGRTLITREICMCRSIPTPPFEIRRKKKKGKKIQTLKTSECKVPDQAQPDKSMSLDLCPAGLPWAIPKSAPPWATRPGDPSWLSCLVTLFVRGCPFACFLPRGRGS